MNEEPQRCVLERDFLSTLRVVGNIYYTWEVAAFDRVTIQAAGAAMSGTGMTEEEFRQMMMNGERPIEGNRSIRQNN